jgi:hypothetical protein
MKNLLKRLWQEESGQDLVEYSFLLAFGGVGRDCGDELPRKRDQHNIIGRGNRTDERSLILSQRR